MYGTEQRTQNVVAEPPSSSRRLPRSASTPHALVPSTRWVRTSAMRGALRLSSLHPMYYYTISCRARRNAHAGFACPWGRRFDHDPCEPLRDLYLRIGVHVRRVPDGPHVRNGLPESPRGAQFLILQRVLARRAIALMCAAAAEPRRGAHTNSHSRFCCVRSFNDFNTAETCAYTSAFALPTGVALRVVTVCAPFRSSGSCSFSYHGSGATRE
jgi:hypothetical protein